MQFIYIAGPDIFRPDARTIAEHQKLLCTRYGFQPLHPLDGPVDQPIPPTMTEAMDIFRANQSRMHTAAAIIANLTPFRGPSADPGTVFELGYMLALARPAVAYSKTATPFRQRTVTSCNGATFDSAVGRWLDGEGLEIEDFGLADNLMIDCSLRSGGMPLITPHTSDESPTDFGCFERCLQTLSRTMTL